MVAALMVTDRGDGKNYFGLPMPSFRRKKRGMKVKADSKGRLTGAKALKSYEKTTQPDGTLTYVPTVPEQFDRTIDVTEAEFEAFFGQSPNETPAEDALDTQRLRQVDQTYYPTGLVIRKFVLTEDGNRVHNGESFVRETTLIRIRKDI